MRNRSPAMILLAASICWTAPGRARPDEPPANAQEQGENGEALKKGMRAKVTLTYTSDLNADIAGGADRGAAYLGRLGLIGDADLDRLIGWRGATAHISIHQVHGEGLSAHRVGNLMAVSGLETAPALRLYSAWIQQSLGPKASLRVGQFTASQKISASREAALFVNSTFGWPASFAADLPSGGPAYPLAAPGARLALKPAPRSALRIAVFAGDPAGKGGGDPLKRDLHGLNGWRFAGKPLVVAEVEREWGSKSSPGLVLSIGGWRHFDRFDDLRLDGSGRSLADPGSTGRPLRHNGDWAVFGIADVLLWKSEHRAAHAFARATWSPPDRNLIDRYAEAGLTLKAPFAGRPDDEAGIAFALARVSHDERALIRARNAASGTSQPVPDFEAVIEGTYQWQVNDWASVQPTVQYVIHPGAGAPMALGLGTGTTSTRNALVIGLRLALRR